MDVQCKAKKNQFETQTICIFFRLFRRLHESVREDWESPKWTMTMKPITILTTITIME